MTTKQAFQQNERGGGSIDGGQHGLHRCSPDPQLQTYHPLVARHRGLPHSNRGRRGNHAVAGNHRDRHDEHGRGGRVFLQTRQVCYLIWMF